MFVSDESMLTDTEFISCGWAHFFPYISEDNRKKKLLNLFPFYQQIQPSRISPIFSPFLKNKWVFFTFLLQAVL